MITFQVLLIGIIFLSIFLPGVLLSLALLRKTNLPLPAIMGFGFILGLIIPSLLLLIESYFGILYSLELVIINIIFTSIIGLLLCLREKVFPIPFSFSWKKDGVWVALLLIMLLAFFIRIQSSGPIFYEFDPYYYMYRAKYLLTEGIVPYTDDTAWYPNKSTHRGSPLTAYITASWYSLYTKGGEYNNYLLSTIANVYPPLVAALLCFLVFLLISEEYGRKYGLVVSAIFAFTPQLIQKFAAGEAEIQPWGIFSAFFFFTAYALSINKADKRLAILSGIAYLSVITGSMYSLVVILVLTGYIGIQSIIHFLRKEELHKFIEINAIIFPFIILGQWLNSLHRIENIFLFSPISSLMNIEVIAVGCALSFAFLIHSIPRFFVKITDFESRVNFIIGLILVGGILLVITPFGEKLFSYVMFGAGFAKPMTAGLGCLAKTVAEESPTAGEFEGALGVLGKNIGDLSMVHIILFTSGLALLHAIYRGSKLGTLFALIIFPISYIGLNKSKYILQLGCMMALSVGIILGEVKKLVRIYIKEPKTYENIALGIGIGVVGLQTFSVASDILPVLIDPAYYVLDSKTETYKYNCGKIASEGKGLSYYLHCSVIPEYWLNAMDWIKENVGEEERVISWWDYGHWINYFGEKKCLTRNEHQYIYMDEEVADRFVYGTSEELKEYMLKHKAKYALFDVDLIGKWGALVFIACCYNNETTTEKWPGESECDAKYQFERVYVPVKPELSEICPIEGAHLVLGYSSQSTSKNPIRYCIGEVGGSKVMFYENMTQNKGYLISPRRVSFRGKLFDEYLVIYDKFGWEDRKGKGYDSVFYKGFFLGELEGFEQVYPPEKLSGPVFPVRIFKIKE